jgi:hypothetical protein
VSLIIVTGTNATAVGSGPVTNAERITGLTGSVLSVQKLGNWKMKGSAMSEHTPERTADDVLRSNEANTYVMSCHLSSPDLYKAMRQDLRIACAEIVKLKADADRLAGALATEPLGFMSRAELQLNIMVNLERLVKRLSKNNSLRYWWDHSKNWVKVQAVLNGNTLKAGSTSSAAQCNFIGADPDGDTFIARTALAEHERGEG